MVVPDSTQIAEILLFAEGFNDTKVQSCSSLAWGMLDGCCEDRRRFLVSRELLKKTLHSDSSHCFVLLLMQILSKKVFTLYSLAMQQLSKQDHYDFGLRSLTSLLRYAGRKRRTVNNVPDEEVKP